MTITTRGNEIHVFHPADGSPASAEATVRLLRTKIQERVAMHPRVYVAHYMDRLDLVDEAYVRPFGRLGKEMKQLVEGFGLGEIAYVVVAKKARHRVLAHFGAMLAGVEVKVFKDRRDVDEYFGAHPPVPSAQIEAALQNADAEQPAASGAS